MDEEAVLINNKGKEIDWVDPVRKHWETKHYWYVDNGAYVYRFWKYKDYKLIIRTIQ